jgi:hypothetical protein
MRSKCLFIPFSICGLFVGSAMAYNPYDPKNCNGVDWDDKKPLVAARVTGASRIHFIKSTYDDDFKAESCPNSTEACRRKSYLVTSDLVLMGKSLGPFTCSSYQSSLAKKQIWEFGWLPTETLTPVKPASQTVVSDWLGRWSHPGGHVEVKQGEKGKLHIDAFMVVPTFRDFHNGSFNANVVPHNDRIDITDDGDGCRVRIQRIQSWLMVQDNDGCGGAGVTFTGLYRRNP